MLKDNIALLRDFIGISQRELGRRIDMTGQYIAKIEKGERMPTTETLNKIVSALSDNTFGRQFYLEELTSQPYTFIELIYKNIISKKMRFDFLRRHLGITPKELQSVLTGIMPLNTCCGIDRILNRLDMNSTHIDKYLALDKCILSSLTEEETTEYYSALEKNYLSWDMECKAPLTTRLLNTIYTVLSTTKSQDEIIKTFIELTQASEEKITSWISLCSRSRLFNIELDYSIQNSLSLYLYTLAPEKCSLLIQDYPFDLHPNVKRYYEQLTNTISSTSENCSTYLLSEYLLSHNLNISGLDEKQFSSLDDEIKKFVEYQLYKLSTHTD
ncbi:MAG: helix-turn-helix domain-containing protein [Cellulosilyticaceae bacterium]